MNLPPLPEQHHPLIQPLLSRSDGDLLQLWQQYPDRGQYFTTLFCRYAHLVYALLSHCAPSSLQVDYLFAKTWQKLLERLQPGISGIADLPPQPLSTWITEITALTMHQQEIPPIANIQYSLEDAPPPLWCYLEMAIAQLPEPTRLIMLMSQTFHWSENRIVAYLQSEGKQRSPDESMTVAEIQEQLQQGYQLLNQLLPQDIQEIYLPAIAITPQA